MVNLNTQCEELYFPMQISNVSVEKRDQIEIPTHPLEHITTISFLT